MTNWVVYPAVAVFLTALAAMAVGAVRTRRDARRPSNGVWVSAGFVLLWVAAVAASLSLDSGEGLPSWLFVTVVYPMFAVPLVLLVLALFLVVNTVVVVRRERLSLATVAPAAIGVLILMTLVSLVIQFVALICSASPEGRLIFLLLPIAASPGVVLIFELVAYTVYAFVYSRIGTDDVADVVVVLGSGLAGDQVTPLLASRLDAGIAAFERSREAGHNPVMVVSGGKGSDERRSEAEAMAEYVVKEGISRDQVILEAASTSTRENLEFSVATLAERKISWTMMAIATSNFHIMRAASLARQLGIPTLSVGARTAVYYLPSAFLREFAASVVHFRRGTAVASAVVMAAWIAISWYVLSLFDAVRSTL